MRRTVREQEACLGIGMDQKERSTAKSRYLVLNADELMTGLQLY